MKPRGDCLAETRRVDSNFDSTDSLLVARQDPRPRGPGAGSGQQGCGHSPLSLLPEQERSGEDAVHLNGVMEKEEHFIQLNFCLEQLVPEQKQVVELFYLQGKCYNQITLLTGIEWKKVRSFIQNGRRNLKICMDKKIGIS